jgi:hypothetical protein
MQNLNSQFRNPNSAVGAPRLELGTSALSGLRSNQLSYAPDSAVTKMAMLPLASPTLAESHILGCPLPLSKGSYGDSGSLGKLHRSGS